MGFFDRFKRTKPESEKQSKSLRQPQIVPAEPLVFQDVDPSTAEQVSDDVLKQLSLAHPDASWHVKRVVEIDVEKELVAVITGAIAASDRPDSVFRLKKIVEIEKE